MVTRVDPYVRVLFPDLARRLNASDDGHLDVHQDDVGDELPGACNGFLAAGHFTHNLQGVHLLQNRADALAKQGVIVS